MKVVKKKQKKKEEKKKAKKRIRKKCDNATAKRKSKYEHRM